MPGGWGSKTGGARLGTWWDGIEVNTAGTHARITNPRVVLDRDSGFAAVTADSWLYGGGAASLYAVADFEKSNISGLSGSGQKLLINPVANWVPLQFNAAAKRSFDAGLQFYKSNGSDYWPEVFNDITYPIRPYAVPSAPTATLVRLSDLQGRINISGNQTNAAADKYWQYLDWRLRVDGGAWSAVKTVAGTTTQILVDSLAINKKYEISIVARNSTGSSSATIPPAIYTTPTYPSNIKASRSGANVILSFTPGSTWRSGTQIERRENGGAWTTLVTATGTSYTHTGASSASTWQYRLRNVVETPGSSGPVTLNSVWVESAIVLALPDAPTIGATGRASEGVHTIVWTRPPTADGTVKPYQSQEIQYQVGNDSQSFTLTSVGATVTSTSHTGLPANTRYRYRVRGANSSGESAWSAWSSWIPTTPAPVTGVTLTRVGSTLTLRWVNAPFITGVDVSHQEGSNPWVLEASLGVVVEYIDTDANPATSHRYRIKSKTQAPVAGGGTVTLESAWVESPLIQIILPPLDPTVSVTPSVLDAAYGGVNVEWVHNPVDGTSQQNAQVRYRVVGAGSWIQPATLTTENSLVIGGSNLLNNLTYEVQVRTRGEDTNYGPWSTSRLFVTVPTPAATIISPTPAQVLTGSILTAEVSASTPGSNILGWEFRLRDVDLNILGAVIVPGEVETWVAPWVLQDNKTYTFDARVQNGPGLWSSWSSITFSSSFDAPPEPSVTSQWLKEWGEVQLDIHIPEPAEGEASPTRLVIARLGAVIYDGPVVAGNFSVVDRIPPLGKTVDYEVTIWSTIPSSTTIPHQAYTEPGIWAFLNGGDGWNTRAKLWANLRDKVGLDRDKELVWYEGRELPVEFLGRAINHTHQVDGVLATEEYGSVVEQWGNFIRVAKLPAPICYRDPDGNRLFISISGLGGAREPSPLMPISFTVTEVDDGE